MKFNLTNAGYEDLGIVEINTLEELMRFQKKCKNSIIIEPSDDAYYDNDYQIIRIYDDYLE